MVVVNVKDYWITLRQYQDSINFMKSKNPKKFRNAIVKEERIYKDVIKELNEQSNH